jgi:hypothetical protein
MLHSPRPDLYASGVLPRGNPDLPDTVQFSCNNEKGKKIIGLKYKTLKEIFMETLVDSKEQGWFKKQN